MADVVAETSLVHAERTRLPRLRSLVMGGAATVALVALVLPDGGSAAPSAPRRAPELAVPAWSAFAPRSEVLEFLTHEAVTHPGAKAATVRSSASSTTHVSVSATSNAQASTTTKTESHVSSNVQAAPANVSSHSQVQTNSVATTSSGKNVSSNHSVIVSNNGSRNVTSGSASDAMDVPSSFGLPSPQDLFPSIP